MRILKFEPDNKAIREKISRTLLGAKHNEAWKFADIMYNAGPQYAAAVTFNEFGGIAEKENKNEYFTNAMNCAAKKLLPMDTDNIARYYTDTCELGRKCFCEGVKQSLLVLNSKCKAATAVIEKEVNLFDENTN